MGMKRLLMISLLLGAQAHAQRGYTGEQTFAHIFPNDAIHGVPGTELIIDNTTDDDVIVVVRDGSYNYLRHVYIRNNDNWLFQEMHPGHHIYQFRSKDKYYESPTRIPVLFGEKAYLNFYHKAGAERIISFEISEEEFFRN